MPNRIGKMRHVITFQEKTATTDSNGVRTETWANKSGFENIPASFRALTARELQAAGATRSEATVEFEIRADIDVTPDLRISFDGEVYDISEALLDGTRQRFYRIKAARGLTDG